ncbi:unnamed protein product, partial [Urochloa humidicola]
SVNPSLPFLSTKADEKAVVPWPSRCRRCSSADSEEMQRQWLRGDVGPCWPWRRRPVVAEWAGGVVVD